MTKKTIITLSLTLLTICCINLSAETIEDIPYLQETSIKIPSDKPIISLAFYNEKLYAATATTLKVIDNDTLTKIPCPAKNIRRLKSIAAAATS